MIHPRLIRSNRLSIGLFLVLLTAGGSIQAQTTYSLDDCISQALVDSPRLHVARNQVEMRKQTAAASHAKRLPQLTASGKMSYVSDVQSLNLPANPAFPTGMSIQFGDNTSYTMAVRVSVPLYTGGSLAAQEKANRIEADAAERDLAADNLTVLYEVRRAYFRSLAANEGFRLANNALERLQRHRKDVENMQKVGMADEESRLTLLSHIRQAEQRVASSEAFLRSARLELGRVIGHPGEEIVAEGGLEAPIADSSLAYTPTHRPDLEALSLRAESVDRKIRAAKGSYLPTVAAVAAYNYGKPGVDYIKNDWMGYTTAGISLNWTLFDWSARKHTVQSVRASRNALTEAKRSLAQIWQTRHDGARIRLVSARKERIAAKSRLDLERERYQLIEGQRSQGQISERDLLDAQDDLASAEIGFAQAQTNERLAETELLYASAR